MDLHFNQPIAQRSLVGPHGATVDVMLGAPRPFDGSDGRVGWYCPFRVENIDGRPWIAYGAGVDGVQALILALVRVGEYLDFRADLDLSFDGSQDLGFLSATILSNQCRGSEE